MDFIPVYMVANFLEIVIYKQRRLAIETVGLNFSGRISPATF
jgi:hypothetical protein